MFTGRGESNSSFTMPLDSHRNPNTIVTLTETCAMHGTPITSMMVYTKIKSRIWLNDCVSQFLPANSLRYSVHTTQGIRDKGINSQLGKPGCGPAPPHLDSLTVRGRMLSPGSRRNRKQRVDSQQRRRTNLRSSTCCVKRYRKGSISSIEPAASMLLICLKLWTLPKRPGEAIALFLLFWKELKAHQGCGRRLAALA